MNYFSQFLNNNNDRCTSCQCHEDESLEERSSSPTINTILPARAFLKQVENYVSSLPAVDEEDRIAPKKSVVASGSSQTSELNICPSASNKDLSNASERQMVGGDINVPHSSNSSMYTDLVIIDQWRFHQEDSNQAHGITLNRSNNKSETYTNLDNAVNSTFCDCNGNGIPNTPKHISDLSINLENESTRSQMHDICNGVVANQSCSALKIEHVNNLKVAKSEQRNHAILRDIVQVNDQCSNPLTGQNNKVQTKEHTISVEFNSNTTATESAGSASEQSHEQDIFSISKNNNKDNACKSTHPRKVSLRHRFQSGRKKYNSISSSEVQACTITGQRNGSRLIKRTRSFVTSNCTNEHNNSPGLQPSTITVNNWKRWLRKLPTGGDIRRRHSRRIKRQVQLILSATLY